MYADILFIHLFSSVTYHQAPVDCGGVFRFANPPANGKQRQTRLTNKKQG